MDTQSRTGPSPLPRHAAPGAAAPGLAQTAVLLLGRSGGGLGGFTGLEAAFARARLGDEFASWVGTGPNLPVSAADVCRALGPSVEALADATRSDSRRVAEGLAELLPRVVDGLTPDGRRPAGGRVASLWALARLLLMRPRRVTP